MVRVLSEDPRRKMWCTPSLWSERNSLGYSSTRQGKTEDLRVSVPVIRRPLGKQVPQVIMLSGFLLRGGQHSGNYSDHHVNGLFDSASGSQSLSSLWRQRIGARFVWKKVHSSKSKWKSPVPGISGVQEEWTRSASNGIRSERKVHKQMPNSRAETNRMQELSKSAR